MFTLTTSFGSSPLNKKFRTQISIKVVTPPLYSSKPTIYLIEDIYQSCQKSNAFVIRISRSGVERRGLGDEEEERTISFLALSMFTGSLSTNGRTGCVVSNFWVAIGRGRFRFDTP